jgi:hypothetical protein
MAGLIEKEILKKRITNIEQGIMNPPPADKCRSKVFYRFILIRNSQSEAIPHFIISASGGFDIRYSKPSQPPAKKTASLIEKKTLILCYRRVGHDTTELVAGRAD